MRFWLILLQLGSFCTVITIISFMAVLLSDPSGQPVSLFQLLGGAGLFLALEALLVFLSQGAIVATFGPALAAITTPFLVIAAVSFACAILSGYKRWVRWIGFIINLVVGLLFLAVTFERKFDVFPLIPAVFYLANAFLFFQVRRKDDAERLRRSATVLQIALCVSGLAFSCLTSRHTGVLTLVITSIFYILFFVLHYRAIKSIRLEVKSLAKTVGALVLTLAAVIVLLFIRPVMVGPLLLSWLSTIVFAETLFLSILQAEKDQKKCVTTG